MKYIFERFTHGSMQMYNQLEEAKVSEKRIAGSISPKLLNCKKCNCDANGDDLSGQNALKKPKLNMGILVRSGKPVLGSGITKDEEKVAETLYALPDMLETSNDKTKLSDVPSKLGSTSVTGIGYNEYQISSGKGNVRLSYTEL